MSSSHRHIAGGYYLSSRAISEDLEEKPAHYFKLFDWMVRRAFFRDGRDLKRGEFMTTIDEMRNVGGYASGSARKPLTKDQVRSAYGYLTDTGRIATRKTTRGMIITVCNYEVLQDPKSYAPHAAAHAVTLAETTRTPPDRVKKEEKKGKKEKQAHSPDALRLSGRLADLIIENNSRNTHLTPEKRTATIARWAEAIDKLYRIDGAAWKEIEAVIEWCQRDQFWSGNILSGETLRKQWNRLTTKMKLTTGSTVASVAEASIWDDALTREICSRTSS